MTETKVGELALEVRIKKDVMRLEIAVDQGLSLTGVDKDKSQTYLVHHVGAHVPCEKIGSFLRQSSRLLFGRLS